MSLYLLAHLVRGKPTFDIGRKLTIGDEDGWIVPTSGHRAYPFWYIALDQLIPLEIIDRRTDHHETFFDLTEADSPAYALAEGLIPVPEGHPDHYSVCSAPRADLSAALSALFAPQPFTRRKL